MYIIGIHDGHNSTISLLDDGIIKNVLQEERLKNEKNYFGFPELSFEKILIMNNLKIEDISTFVFTGNHLAHPFDKNGLLRRYASSFSIKERAKYVLKKTFVYSIYKRKRKNARIQPLLERGIDVSKIHFVEHHLCHASTAYYGCPWVDYEEKTLILTQDGSGDGLSGTVSIGQRGKIERLASINKDDSLGRIYATVTFMLGMVPLEHEYKLMGMAPYSPHAGKFRSYKVFKDLLCFDEKNPLVWRRNKQLPAMQNIYPYLRKKTELHRFDWIAAGIQQFTEEMLVKWVKNCIKQTGIKKIVLSGGTFMNVKANQRISELPEVEKLFIFPSCGDESNAIGAAYYSYFTKNIKKQSKGISNLYLGPDETGDENTLTAITELKNKNSVNFDFMLMNDIETRIAELLSENHIVARCKGQMEFGARALGNRSILSDASDLEKISVINNMIKKRDFWMPFAPVILRERCDDYVINHKNIDASFMMITLNSTSRYKEFIGGVQQVDLTARPQIIDENHNKNYYKILKKFESLTGKGVLVNTSFNLHGLPIVYGPKEALYVFENSGLNYLAVGNYLVWKI
ncbi:MAG: hypothetical protein L3J08_08145 [Flavobacteriaceae bacterium]|nr:hypothetical protein [Flavobacteriaceae bacterium]